MDVLALLGPLSICVTLLLLGILSQRLGRVTHARPYYLGLFLAAALAAGAVIVRALRLTDAREPLTDWSLIYHALLSAAVTLGLLVAWYYWSWLLAERD